MKWIFTLFLALSASAQLPVIPSGFNFPPQIPAFSPFNVPGMMLYVDARTTVTNTSGTTPPANLDPVKSMGDMSPQHWHLIHQTTGGAGNQPVFLSTRGPDGGGCIAWSNSPVSTAALTNAMGGVNIVQPYCVFFVFCIPTLVSGSGMLNSYANQNMQIWLSGTIQMYAGTQQGTGQSMISTPPGTFLWYVETFIFNGASSGTRTNGVAGSALAGSIGTASTSGITLGNYFNYSGSLDTFWLRSAMIFTNLTDVPTIHNIEKWLGSTNNITIH